MTVIANTLYGNAGLICHPTTIGGLIYFADNCSTPAQAVIRSYDTLSGAVNNNAIPLTSASAVNAMCAVGNGKFLWVVYNTATSTLMTVFDSTSGAVIASKDITGVKTLPYAYMVSGNSRYVFYADYLAASTSSNVNIWDTASNTIASIATGTPLFPSGWNPVDMVLANDYSSGYVGRLCVDTYNPSGTSSAIYIYTIPPTPPYISGTWTNATPAVIATGTYAAVSTSASVYSHAGLAIITTRSVSDDVYAKYSYSAPGGWTGRYGHSMTRVSGYLVIMGGNQDATTTSGTNEIWRSIDQGATWVQTSAPSWNARFYSAVVTYGSTIVLMGGEGGLTSGRNDVWRSTNGCVDWTCMTSNAAWSTRCNFGFTRTTTTVIGGREVATGTYLNDVWISVDDGATWVQSDSGNAGFKGRMGHIITMAIGGY
jgi:hypothetical protein